MTNPLRAEKLGLDEQFTNGLPPSKREAFVEAALLAELVHLVDELKLSPKAFEQRGKPPVAHC